MRAINKHFPNIPIDIVGENKEGTYGRVLVDDYPGYIDGWLRWRPRGLVIMPAHYYNADYNHENVIRYNRENIEQVRQALKAAFEREPKEHWKDRL